MHALEDLGTHPSTARIVETVLAVWPEHRGYCAARFRDDDPGFRDRTEAVAALVLRQVGDSLELYCRDYRWMCERFLEEEIHFARHRQYRLKTFDEANREVYADPAYMSRYVRGILISQILWTPHARAFDYFRTRFLAALAPDADYLEIGPGHGLFLYFASQQPRIASLEAWDVSESSIAETRKTLARLGAEREIDILLQDVLAAPSRHDEFDGAVISEVLEHLERPILRCARSMRRCARAGGSSSTRRSTARRQITSIFGAPRTSSSASSRIRASRSKTLPSSQSPASRSSARWRVT